MKINQADTLTEMSVEVEPEAADDGNLAKRLAIAFQENLSFGCRSAWPNSIASHGLS